MTNTLIIEPEALASGQLSNALLVDVGQATRYNRCHIPRAIHLPPSALMMGNGPTPGQLPPLARIHQALTAIGFHPDRPCVIYDDEGGGWAGRLLWTLHLLGFHNGVYLNGGLLAWHREGHVRETAAPHLAPTQPAFEVTLKNPQLQTHRAQILKHLQDPDTLLWDARSEQEYQAGHIPGALHFEWSQGMDPSRHQRIRHDLAQRLQQVGIIPDKKIIVYCVAHHRSAFAYMAAKALGFPQISAYDGAWTEWTHHPDSPIERS